MIARNSYIIPVRNATNKSAFTIFCNRIYDPKHHRKFMSGEWTDKQVFQEFLSTFDSPNNKDYIVSEHQKK